jgi:two-component system cell cycle sensor histidine kinase/response regulator CckA
LSTVLVVDDEPMVREMVALMLETDGFSVLKARDGADAIDISRSHRGEINLLVTDVTMPGMDGCDLAEELQTVNPSLEVLMISGFYENRVAERCSRFSMLAKPFSMTSLLSVVRALLGRPAHRGSPR